MHVLIQQKRKGPPAVLSFTTDEALYNAWGETVLTHSYRITVVPQNLQDDIFPLFTLKTMKASESWRYKNQTSIFLPTASENVPSTPQLLFLQAFSEQVCPPGQTSPLNQLSYLCQNQSSGNNRREQSHL
ncbi:hypothetical protein MHYP_G00112310 [Metynnis hypsauchen]